MADNTEIDNDIIKGLLAMAVGILHTIDLPDMQAYVEGVSKNNATYDTVGPILDPTEYRNTLHSGRRDHIRTELEIAQKLLEIRVLVDGMGLPKGTRE